MNNNKKMLKKELKKQALFALCRKNFWIYCKTMAPDFYKDSRTYLKELCDQLQDFVESDEKVCVVSIPPRHGKSRTLFMLDDWLYGTTKCQAKIMEASYSKDLAIIQSKNVRNTIMEEKADADKVIYHDIFEDVSVKKGDGSINMWSLEGGYNNWLSTSPNGAATGFGATVIIVDDIVKNSYEAFNESILQGHYDWFVNTMLSRLEAGGKIIIVMTRWSKKDLAGRLLKDYPDARNIVMKAYDSETGKMLCDEILPYEDYVDKTRNMDEAIKEANYNQCPIDVKGKLYTSFNRYHLNSNNQIVVNNKIVNIKRIVSVTDTADTGEDWLCSIIFAEDYYKNAYILDIYYTKDSAEITIPELARFFKRNKVSMAVIESNNGGRLFALAIKKELEEELKYYPSVKWFHQSRNKKARILSTAKDVINRVFYPENLEKEHKEYFTDMDEYQKEGEAEHDDAPDCTTMVIEFMDGQLIKK